MDAADIPVNGETLRAAFFRRVESCRRLADEADNARDVQLALVLRQLDLPEVIRAIIAACKAADEGVVRAWVANFTKVVILVGDPHKVATRHRVACSERAVVGWFGPLPAAKVDPLRRLLRPLQTAGQRWIPGAISVPLDAAEGRPLELAVAIQGLSLAEFLIAVSHVVAESYLLGHLSGASTIVVRPVAQLETMSERDIYVRVHRSSDDEHSLRLLARLFAA